jgi:cytidyltransferase-like protein
VNPQLPTALFIGRYQPFHEGHKKLIETGIRRVGQVCIAIRNTYEIGGSKNPFTYKEIRERIDDMMSEHKGKYEIVLLPNITNVMYGRDVGYDFEQLELDPEIEAISGTEIRKQMNGQ